MKKIIFLFSFYFCFISAFGQITFQKTYGGTAFCGDGAVSVRQTTDGGYIMTGSTSCFGAGNTDFYIIRTDINGDTIWTKTFGGTSLDGAWLGFETTDGGYIIIGNTHSFGAGDYDVYLIKVDANGDSLWTKTFGGIGLDNGTSVQQTTDSGYIITGWTYSFGAGYNDVYVIKTDSNGNSIWQKTYGGLGGEETAYSIQQTSDGGYIIIGGTNSFGTGNLDVYLIKTDFFGNLIWTKTFGGPNDDFGTFVQQTTDGGYIISGYTNSFGAGDWDVYLIKTDSIGNSLWSKTFGGSGYDRGQSIQQTADRGYIIAGFTNSFGAGFSDIFLVKTDSLGNLLWTKTFGGTASDAGYSIRQTTDLGYIITGVAHFGNSQDVYLIKTDSLGNSGCNQSNPATIVTTPATIVTTPATIVTSPPTIVTTPATIVGSGGTVTTLCTSVGINEITTNNDFSVSPNPSNGNFKINYTLPKNKEGNLQIVDVTGKSIYKQKLPMWSALQNISLPKIANGIYNCTITSGEMRVNKKLVVIR